MEKFEKYYNRNVYLYRKALDFHYKAKQYRKYVIENIKPRNISDSKINVTIDLYSAFYAYKVEQAFHFKLECSILERYNNLSHYYKANSASESQIYYNKLNGKVPFKKQ